MYWKFILKYIKISKDLNMLIYKKIDLRLFNREIDLKEYYYHYK